MRKILLTLAGLLLFTCTMPTNAGYVSKVEIKRDGLEIIVRADNQEFYIYQIDSEYKTMQRKY
jgi:hypothetical protein